MAFRRWFNLAGLEPEALAGLRDRQGEFDVEGVSGSDPNPRAGLVYSKHGKHGGYALGRPPENIQVGSIVRVLDGPLAPIRCASVTAYRACDDCAGLRNCPVRLVMVDARNAVAHLLDNYTLAEMRALKEPLQLADMYDI